MKTIAIRCGLAAVFLPAAFAAHACDLCAVYTAGMAHGETSGWYAGIFEQFTNYDELRDEGHVIHDDSGQYLDSSITQLFVGYGATDRLSLQLNVPYIYRTFKRPEDGEIQHGVESGLGDITALAQYTLLRHDDEDETCVWRALGGIKFGTGDTDRLTEELDEGPQSAAVKHGGHDDAEAISGIHGHDLTLGSGSTDFLVGTSGFYRRGRWYGEADVQYAIRQTGDFDYRFGNDLQWVLSAGRYLVLEHDHTVSLQLNLSGEDKDYDEVNGVRADDTQSRVLFLGPQMGFTFGPRWSLELRADFPVHIENSSIQTTVGWRGQAAFVGKF
jgi:hypothetical protein